jgi:hypothetical protein
MPKVSGQGRNEAHSRLTASDRPEQRAQLFQLFRKYSDVITRVSFWNLQDGKAGFC